MRNASQVGASEEGQFSRGVLPSCSVVAPSTTHGFAPHEFLHSHTHTQRPKHTAKFRWPFPTVLVPSSRCPVALPRILRHIFQAMSFATLPEIPILARINGQHGRHRGIGTDAQNKEVDTCAATTLSSIFVHCVSHPRLKTHASGNALTELVSIQTCGGPKFHAAPSMPDCLVGRRGGIASQEHRSA